MIHAPRHAVVPAGKAGVVPTCPCPNSVIFSHRYRHLEEQLGAGEETRITRAREEGSGGREESKCERAGKNFRGPVVSRPAGGERRRRWGTNTKNCSVIVMTNTGPTG